jgi:hypothetical protein
MTAAKAPRRKRAQPGTNPAAAVVARAGLPPRQGPDAGAVWQQPAARGRPAQRGTPRSRSGAGKARGKGR